MSTFILSRSESHYSWIWWLSTLFKKKKKKAAFVFSWLLSQMKVLVIVFKKSRKVYTLEIIYILHLLKCHCFSFLFPCNASFLYMFLSVQYLSYKMHWVLLIFWCFYKCLQPPVPKGSVVVHKTCREKKLTLFGW